MQIIGTLVDLIHSINAAIPPLSDPVIPSTSSIIIKNSLLGLNKFIKTRLSIKSFKIFLNDNLFLLSEALFIIVFKFKASATNLTKEVFPIPGGPLIIHAFELFIKKFHTLNFQPIKIDPFSLE